MYICKQYLALNNLQGLIYHKTQRNKQKQPVPRREKSEFKPALLLLENDLLSHPNVEVEFGKYIDQE